MKDIAKFFVYTGIFAIPFIPLIISNTLFFPFITGKNFTFRIIAEIVFASWIILACYDPVYRPKRSFILGSFTVFLLIILLADAFGVHRLSSFWSNFERMEGFMAILHTWMYFVATASVLTTDKLWNRFFNTVFVSSIILTLYAFAQLSGSITINQGGWRLDGTLGNSAYMAIYMLFNIFFAFLMLARTTSKRMRYVYVALAVLFVYLLIQTATRGTILGFVGGAGITAAYIALFTKDKPQLRRIGAGTLLVLVLIVGLFVTFRKSSVIQENPYLGRVANISLSEGNVRFKVWHMAYEGFKERPLLGWGQSNFTYVFNEHYDPRIYFAESWYDRVHNIVFDWLIAGGILGLLAYFALYFSSLYYLFLRPLMKQDDSFTVAERGILLGLLAGYLFHNLFVFDNIVSYIYYGTVLAFIHSRVGTPIPKLVSWKSNRTVIEQVILPVMGVALVATLYFVNVPGIKAAGDIIDAFRTQDPDAMMAAFDRALSRNSFGNQEIREQMTRKAQEVIFSQSVPQEKKDAFIAKVETELKKQIAEKPNDARAHVFIASFYRSLGTPESLDKAIVELDRARELSPKKQQIIFEQGLAFLQKQEYERAYELFKEAYELETSYVEARVYYAISGLVTNRYNILDEVLTDDASRDAFNTNDLVVRFAYQEKIYPLLKTIFEYRIAKSPQDTQVRTNLAYILNESGDQKGAVEVLTKAGVDIPEFKAQADEFITEMQKEKSSTVKE